MTRLYICPCCERPSVPRPTPISAAECEKAFGWLYAKGWTRARLLAERRDDIDYLAPGLSDWLRAQPDLP